MAETMVLIQFKIPAQLDKALRARAKILNLRLVDVTRWALAREVDEPTLATKGSNIAGIIGMLVRSGNDHDEILAELQQALDYETKRPEWDWDRASRRRSMRSAKQ